MTRCHFWALESPNEDDLRQAAALTLAIAAIGGLYAGLKHLSGQWDLLPFLALCVGIFLAALFIGWRVDVSRAKSQAGETERQAELRSAFELGGRAALMRPDYRDTLGPDETLEPAPRAKALPPPQGMSRDRR